jgi:kynurenine formamidase
MKKFLIAVFAIGVAAAWPSTGGAQSEQEVVKRSLAFIPTKAWPPGDERGMANAIGTGTWLRCSYYLSQPKSKAYELSHVRSTTMPLSPFSAPYVYKFNGTKRLPGSIQGFNTEEMSGEPAQQGTQMDALGHFAYFPDTWDGKSPPSTDGGMYYGGFTQKDVKPTPDSPLMKLGMEKAAPIVTSAVLLDAKSYVGKGEIMKPGQTVTAKDIEGMIRAQGLSGRGLLPGDVLYVYTGWGDNWKDPDTEKFYYTMAPGLSYDAVQYIASKRVVAVGLDTPFVDAVNEGELQGKAGPPASSPPNIPFPSHHVLIAKSGIHHVENANLTEIARDKVWTSCTMILPVLEQGSAGSPIRPIAIGVPRAPRR